jgi:glycosyltransferase involved in cell wall biosynthesis
MPDPRTASSAAGPPAIGYVLKGFPRISELFIASEVHRLESLGVRLHLFVIKPGEEPLRHAVVDRIRATPQYLPQVASVSAVPLWRWLATHFRLFVPALRRTIRRRPLGTLRATTWALWLAFRTRPTFWSPLRKVYVKELLLGIALADLVLDAPEIQQLHAHFCHGATTVTWLAAMIVGLPFSFTAHAKDIYSPSLNPAGLLERKLAAARFAVTCTEANREYLRRFAGNTPVYRIYHGLNAEFTSLVGDAPPTMGRRDGAFHVLGVGRVVEKKGFDVLVEACGILLRRGVPVTATIVGEPGDHAAVVDARINAFGLKDRVRRLPPMTQAELFEEYRRASVFCLPCRILDNGDRDGIPNVILEAMAAGVPVVTTGISGIPEVISDGVTGLLVPPDNPRATAEAMARIHADPALAGRLALQAQTLVRDRFDGDRLASELAALFTRSLA